MLAYLNQEFQVWRCIEKSEGLSKKLIVLSGSNSPNNTVCRSMEIHPIRQFCRSVEIHERNQFLRVMIIYLRSRLWRSVMEYVPQFCLAVCELMHTFQPLWKKINRKIRFVKNIDNDYKYKQSIYSELQANLAMVWIQNHHNCSDVSGP